MPRVPSMHLFQPKGLALRLWSLLLASGLSLMAAPPHAGQDCAARTLRAWADPSPGRIFVVAHRADWRNFPENSLAAIDGSIACVTGSGAPRFTPSQLSARH